jgi:thiamine-phosphate pyrophosphorylase
MQAVHGGVTCVQYSDPHVNLHTKFKTAFSLKENLQACGIPLIVNNDIDVALAVQANGVHLGQKDLAYVQARSILGSRAIIGLTVNIWDDVLEAEEFDVDYLGVQIFPSKHTKPVSTALWGLEGLRKICAISRHRIVTIGGINLRNLSHVYKELNINERGDGVAMVGELWRSDDPKIAAKRVKDLFHKFSIDRRDHASF